MAEFNAGSIIGSLDISLDPFQAGLDKAAAQADEFEAKHGVNVEADLDTAPFEASAAKVTAETDKLSAEKAEVKVDADTSAATAKMALFKHEVDSASGADGGGHGMLYLMGLAASLAPALAPGIAAAGLFGSAALAGMAQAGIGLGAFVAVAKSDFGDLQAAIKKGVDLKGPAGEAENALKAFDKAWLKVKADTAGPVFGVMTTALHDAAGLLPLIEPLVVSVAHGLQGAVGQINTWLSSPQFAQFLSMIEKDAVPDIHALTGALINFGSGFMNIIEGLNPITQIFVGNIGNLSKDFLTFSQNLKNGGIQQVLGFIKENGPATAQLLHDLFSGLLNLAKGLSPLVGPALTFLDALVSAVGHLDLKPLASALGSLLTALSPVLTMLGRLLNIIIPPLSIVIGTLVKSFIMPLVSSLGSQLTPVLEAVGGFLDQLAAPLGTFLGLIANLVNPTGVGLLSQLIVGLIDAVTPLIGPVFDLADALENLVDAGLISIAPLIPPIVGALKALATVLAPMIEFAAKVIQWGPVASILARVAVSLWAIQKGAAALSILGTVITFLKGLELASIADTIALKAMYIWEGLVTVATKSWAIVQGIMDAIEAIWDADLLIAVGLELLAAAPFILIAAGVALLILGIIELVKHWGVVWAWVKKIGDYIGGAFMDAWHHVESFFKTIGSAIMGFFADAGRWLLNIGKDIIHGLLDGIEWYFKILYTWYVKIPIQLVKWLYGADKWLYTIGWNVIIGFWNGMMAVFGKMESWVQSAFGGLGKIVSGVLGVFSPSRVFAEIGKFTAMGFHQGFQNEFEGTFLPYVKGAMESLAKVTSEGLTSSSSITATVTHSADATNKSLAAVVDHLNTLTTVTGKLGTDLATVMATSVADIGTQMETSHKATTKAVTTAFVKAQDQSTNTIIKAVRKG